MSGNYKGKDGIARNYYKLLEHWQLLKKNMLPYWHEFLMKPDTHNYVDLYVESGRIPKNKDANYLMGHVHAVYYPVTLGLIFWLIDPAFLGFILFTLLVLIRVKGKRLRNVKEAEKAKEG